MTTGVGVGVGVDMAAAHQGGVIALHGAGTAAGRIAAVDLGTVDAHQAIVFPGVHHPGEQVAR